MPSIVPVCRMSSPTRLVQRLFLFTAMLLCLATATAAEPVAVQRTDPLEASMAGEFALQGGQLPAAARHYLDAATAAQDPVLAERATRIALLADEDALARDAFRLWQALAPEGSTGQRMVAAGLALRAGDKRQARRDGYLMEAELRQKDGDVAGERDAYARGLASFTDNLDLLYARALMWERQDDIVAAEADLRRILVIAPDNVAALNALGYTLADRTQRYREALALIDRARVAEPGNAAIIDSYGWVLFRLGKPREALEHLRHAFALQQDPDIATHLGQVLWHLGRKEEARRHFDEARRLDPDNRSLRRALQETGA